MSESASEVPDQPYSINSSGMLECKWPGCTSTFTQDTSGLKAFAAHWAAHKKKGLKTSEPRKGLTPEELTTLLDWRKQYDEQSRQAVVKTCAQILSEKNQIFEVYIPIFDGKIKYARMDVEEFMGIMNLKEEDFLRKAIYIMWSKGDPTATWDKLKSYKMEEIRQIWFYILENTRFLFPMKSKTVESSKHPRSKRST